MPENTKPSEQNSHSYPSDLADDQWLRLQPLLDNVDSSRTRRHQTRDIVDAILYILKTNKAWSDLPDDLPPAKTAYSQFKQWQRNGTWDSVEKILSGHNVQVAPVSHQSTVFVHEGRLNYQSYGRYPASSPSNALSQLNAKNRSPNSRIRKLVAFVVIIIVGFLLYSHIFSSKSVASDSATVQSSSKTQTSNKTQPSSVLQIAKPNPCAPNTQVKLALVSISQRHMWACSGPTVVYDTAVVTGMENYVADTTPVGTFTIYAKETNLYLNGSDSTGSWHDYVYYWMPFLTNKYGSYGFHDATWRSAAEFGNISPYSDEASHGCVEMPLIASAWLFNWVQVGTTVKVLS